MRVAHAVTSHEIMGSIILPILDSTFPRFELTCELFSFVFDRHTQGAF